MSGDKLEGCKWVGNKEVCGHNGCSGGSVSYGAGERSSGYGNDVLFPYTTEEFTLMLL